MCAGPSKWSTTALAKVSNVSTQLNIHEVLSLSLSLGVCLMVFHPCVECNGDQHVPLDSHCRSNNNRKGQAGDARTSAHTLHHQHRRRYVDAVVHPPPQLLCACPPLLICSDASVRMREKTGHR